MLVWNKISERNVGSQRCGKLKRHGFSKAKTSERTVVLRDSGDGQNSQDEQSGNYKERNKKANAGQ